jgi:hypothetical protein
MAARSRSFLPERGRRVHPERVMTLTVLGASL